MDANLSFKPTVSAVNLDHVRPAASTSAAATTELPTEKTVSQLADTSSTRNGPDTADKATKGEVILDPQSRQVIYRVLDAESRRVVWQVPDAAMLRLRAYARNVNGTGCSSGQPSTDVEA